MKDKKRIIFVSDDYPTDDKWTFSVMDDQGNLEPHRPYWTDYSIVGQEYAHEVGKIMDEHREACLLTPDYMKSPQKIMWVFSNFYQAILKVCNNKFGKLEERIKDLEKKIK